MCHVTGVLLGLRRPMGIRTMSTNHDSASRGRTVVDHAEAGRSLVCYSPELAKSGQRAGHCPGEAVRHQEGEGDMEDRAEDRGQEEGRREREVRALSQLLNKRVVTIGGGTRPYWGLSRLKRYPCSVSALRSI